MVDILQMIKSYNFHTEIRSIL